MIMQVGADRWHVANHRDTHVLQMLRRPEPGQQQQLRRAISAARDDDLTPGGGCAPALGGGVLDTGGAAITKKNFRCMRTGADRQVGARPGRGEIRLRRAPAAAIQGGCLVVAATLLTGAVEVGVARNAGLLASLQNGVGQLELCRLVGHVQGTTGAVVFAGAPRLVLCLAEIRQD